MSGVNKVILIGNLGKDPEVRHLDNGATVANFSIATTESYKDRNTGQRVDQTEWHNIVLWRGLADVAEKYLKKGDSVYIEGKLRTRSWEKDGVTRYTTEVVGDQMTMLGGKRNDQGGADSGYQGGQSSYQNDNSSKPAQSTSAPANTPDTDSEMDDLPF
ncbi:single-stranded DNA-binding protein [Marivirga atlantica]|uniref:Single-stranded DNA-binding protein n=1 Tax=Marivirga atlantica TaxID=1548457 RepID=A0A937AK38_9BACT|nr:single-stranded DNA-binding protein [Marivirga atlantica]MBL0764172.1 single-stranded DNA-binding protein [Marivirga atlantica]